jgi:hypothetical protein
MGFRGSRVEQASSSSSGPGSVWDSSPTRTSQALDVVMNVDKSVNRWEEYREQAGVEPA